MRTSGRRWYLWNRTATKIEEEYFLHWLCSISSVYNVWFHRTWQSCQSFCYNSVNLNAIYLFYLWNNYTNASTQWIYYYIFKCLSFRFVYCMALISIQWNILFAIELNIFHLTVCFWSKNVVEVSVQKNMIFGICLQWLLKQVVSHERIVRNFKSSLVFIEPWN